MGTQRMTLLMTPLAMIQLMTRLETPLMTQQMTLQMTPPAMIQLMTRLETPLMTRLETPLMTPPAMIQLMTRLVTPLATIQLMTLLVMTQLMTLLAMIQLGTIPQMMIAALMMNLSQSQRLRLEEELLLLSTLTMMTLKGAYLFQLLPVPVAVLWYLGLVLTCGRPGPRRKSQKLTKLQEA